MPNQPLAFAELLFGGVLLTMAITGHPARDVLAGTISPIVPLDEDVTTGGTTGTPSAGSAGSAAPSSTTGATSGIGGGTYGVALPHATANLRELFWQGPGGIDVKNGVVEPQGFVSGHTDHVHVAANQGTLKTLGKYAQSLGLHVGENPAFGGVTKGIHVADSYHYGGHGSDRAIDVSGPVAKMREFAATVAAYFGVKK